MGLADRASDIGDAIEGFLADGGTVHELRDVLTAWAVAAGLVMHLKQADRSEE